MASGQAWARRSGCAGAVPQGVVADHRRPDHRRRARRRAADIRPLGGLARVLGARRWHRTDAHGRRSPCWIGPEGGFSERERALVPDQVALGPHVMRAETAAMVAGARAVALREKKDHHGHGAGM
ncbi:MAG: 16S rRNA (uracil(1498)-N(3))-methyltransferase [Candidatus Microthrix sp.]|uniref:16S rRNA (Uracil(1498)-N(3))-methyltransferase n=1 Tax=Candidatus Neomicrothrix subdominans TaxID=2954438 RepID=A0A936NEE6_9ACTN|nr:16S rRNA (uracil(1498)-N(3))-methyltransferase [Candidatus Microthrix subdominans]